MTTRPTTAGWPTRRLPRFGVWLASLVLATATPAHLLPGGHLTGPAAAARAALPAPPREPHDADQGSATEIGVKVGFLYNFTELVGWPATTFAESDSPFVVGVLGENIDGSPTFGSILESTLAGKYVGQHPVVVRRFTEAKQAHGAHILYLGTSTRKGVRALVKDLAKTPTLLVSSLLDFAEAGGMVGFSIAKERLTFSINKDVAKQSKLELSSKLLSLAVIVSTKPDDAAN